MATNFLETAKNLKTEMQSLLHALGATKGSIGELLDSARRTEGSMIDREEKEKQEREAKERAERLKALLESETDLAAHAGGNGAEETEEPEAKPETPVVPFEPVPEPKKPVERPTKPREDTRPAQPKSERTQERARKDSPRVQENERRGTDNRAPRRDNPSQRAVMINPPSPSDSNRGRNDRKKPFESTDKKAKNKKTMMKEAGPTARGWEDDGQMGNRRKAKRQQAETPQFKPAPVVIDHAVITTETITVKDLSEKIGKPANEILKKLLMLGIIANINQELDFDTCELIASEFDITLEQQLAKSFEDVLMDAAEDTDAPETLKPRPPVVTIMGRNCAGLQKIMKAALRCSQVTAILSSAR